MSIPIPRRLKQSIKDRVIAKARLWLVYEQHCQLAYSQEGEDLAVARLLRLEERPRTGFYVDVGAHHPTRYSNTQYFHERGWRGINIDATPGSMRAFAARRPRDQNVEVAVAEEEATLTFYEFNASELNGFQKDLATARAQVPGCRLLRTTEVAARRLENILAEHLPKGQHIDFLSVDVEGLDLEVLRSNDWMRYRPALVLVEDSTTMTIADVARTPTATFLAQRGYTLLARTALTLIFAEASRIHGGIFGVGVA